MMLSSTNCPWHGIVVAGALFAGSTAYSGPAHSEPALGEPEVRPDIPETPHPDVQANGVDTPRAFSDEPRRCAGDRQRLSGQYDVRDDTEVMGPRPAPADIHVSFAEEDASGSLSFVWLTGGHTLVSRVKLGLNAEALTTEVVGRSSTIRDLMESPGRRVHEVRVCGLPASSTIYYQVGGPGSWSEVYSVRTGPPPAGQAPFRFVYGGDARGNPPLWDRMSDQLETLDADFMLFNGDFVGNGRDQSLWDIFFERAGDLFANMPLVSVIGNHENDAINYDVLLSSPGDGRNYILRYGNVAFVVFDDNFRDEDLPNIVRPRVERMLQQAGDAEWVVLVNHQPMVSATHHGSDRHLGEHLLDLVDRYHVDLVLHGHNHVYERSVPLRRGIEDPDGTVFVVSGGLGSPLHEAGRDWFTAVAESTYHYVLVEVEGDVMRIRAVDLDGDTIDEFTLQPVGGTSRIEAP